MRRGLLKDLANTPTQIACGYGLYGDLPLLRRLSGSVITVDLLTGTATNQGEELSPPLQIAGETSQWLTDRMTRDGVPEGTVLRAILILTIRTEGRGMLAVECATTLETERQTFDSHGETRWGPGD